jgi:TPR repeat protein
MQLNPDNDDLSNINNSLCEFSQNFNKMNIKEIEPMTQQCINENIFEEDLSIVIDELLNIYFKELNEEKERIVRKRSILNNINNFNINLQEMVKWILNNQNDSNFIYLLGYFTYHGIGVDSDIKKAFKLFQQAANLEHNEAQLELINMFIDGEGANKNYVKAFELSKKLAKKGISYGINLLGYCYINGIGTDINMPKGIELYQKTADLGSCIAQYNLACMYKDGDGIEMDHNKAFELSKKSAEKEYTYGITMLAYCYNYGIGTDIDKQKAFESYQKAADLENHYAQLKMLAVIDLLMP